MKPLTLCIGLLAITTFLYAQTVDYNKIILPDNASSVDFEEKLVQLAWKNHPSNRIVQNNLIIARHDTKIASSEWLNVIRVTGNLNEFNINPDNTLNNQNQFFPRYNFGAIIPLGIFVGIPNQVKRSRELELVAQQNINTQKLAIRAQVLKLYNEYLMFREIFNLRSQELEEAISNFALLEQRFRSGEEQYERYVIGLSNLNKVKIEKIQSQTNFLNSKIGLEEYIGVKLEDVK